MNRWGAYQQKALVAGCVTDGVVVCPRPRRIGVANHFHEPIIRPSSRFIHINNHQQAETCDAKSAGTELLDIIRLKGSYGSPPYFIGSPPTRASNPVIQDEQFGNDTGSPSVTWRNGGAARVKPAPVRIEGFNCRGNCSISGFA